MDDYISDYNQIKFHQDQARREAEHSLPGQGGASPQQIQNYIAFQSHYQDSSNFNQPPPPSSHSSTLDDRAFDLRTNEFQKEEAQRRYLNEQVQIQADAQNVQRDERNAAEQVSSEILASFSKAAQAREAQVSESVRQQEISEGIWRSEANASLLRSQQTMESCHDQDRNSQMQAADLRADFLIRESGVRDAIRHDEIRRTESNQHLQADAIWKSEMRLAENLNSDAVRLGSELEHRRLESDRIRSDSVVQEILLHGMQTDALESARLNRAFEASMLGCERVMAESLSRQNNIANLGFQGLELDRARRELEVRCNEYDRVMSSEISQKISMDMLSNREIEANRLYRDLAVQRTESERIHAESIQKGLETMGLSLAALDADRVRAELEIQRLRTDRILAEESRLTLESVRLNSDREETERLNKELEVLRVQLDRIRSDDSRLTHFTDRLESERIESGRFMRELERQRVEYDLVYVKQLNGERDARLLEQQRIDLKSHYWESEGYRLAGLRIKAEDVEHEHNENRKVESWEEGEKENQKLMVRDSNFYYDFDHYEPQSKFHEQSNRADNIGFLTADENRRKGAKEFSSLPDQRPPVSLKTAFSAGGSIARQAVSEMLGSRRFSEVEELNKLWQIASKNQTLSYQTSQAKFRALIAESNSEEALLVRSALAFGNVAIISTGGAYRFRLDDKAYRRETPT
jgi:hypothetical protein